MYIALIQLLLVVVASLVTWCELTSIFSHSFFSVVARYCTSISLLILSYYAQYLNIAPLPLVLAFFATTIALTVITFKYLLKEYLRRTRILKLRENNRGNKTNE